MTSDPRPPGTLDFGDADLHLLAEGTHANLYEKLGAQFRAGLSGGDAGARGTGTRFAVWAPNA